VVRHNEIDFWNTLASRLSSPWLFLGAFEQTMAAAGPRTDLQLIPPSGVCFTNSSLMSAIRRIICFDAFCRIGRCRF
jgi:hypothetical protein